MKKFHFNLILVLLLAFASSAPVCAQYTKGYYDRMDGKKEAALKAAAKECVLSHDVLQYYDLPIYWATSDVYPEKVSGQTRWWEMYSDEVYLIRPSQSPKSSFSANKMQREHSVPKSWWKVGSDVEYTPAYSDMWNLYPSDAPANQAKLNYPLGETRSTTFNNGVSKVGAAKAGLGGGCAYVFEPADQYKGDFARSFFYMATVYDDLPWKYTYMFRTQTYPTLQPWAIDMLLQWARLDPVSQKEIDRNNAVEKSQGNRNPFIDFPELAEYIWGMRKSETFIIADQGGNVTPPITGDTEILQPVTGESVDFGQTARGVSVTSWVRIRGKNLTSPLSLTIGGADRKYFQAGVKQISPTLINAAEYYDFPIIYTPVATGRHEARLVLYDGGLPDGYTISVTLIGEALEVPVLSTLTALEPTGVTPTSYTARWTQAPETVDYYIVTRTVISGDDSETQEYQTPVNSITFTDRDESATETYSVRSWRLGVMSDASNTITLQASGVEGVSASEPRSILAMPGGIMLAGEAPRQTISVYDVSGRLLQRAELNGGDSLALPDGLYIITTNAARCPLKMVVGSMN